MKNSSNAVSLDDRKDEMENFHNFKGNVLQNVKSMEILTKPYQEETCQLILGKTERNFSLISLENESTGILSLCLLHLT